MEVPASSTEPQRAPTARSVCRGDPINTVSSHLFPAGCVAVEGCIQRWYRKLATWGGGWGAATRNIITAQTKPFTFSCILRHGWLQVKQCPLSNFKEFVCCSSQCWWHRLPLHCLKYSKVECESRNTAWTQKVRLFNKCMQRCITPVRENLRHMLNRCNRKGALTAGH